MVRYLSISLVVFLAVAQVQGQEPETYRERLEFDPQAGEWREVAPPVPGTDAGDLAIARALLARNEYKDARKKFKEWFELYPDSALRAEALFYAAETEVSAEDADPKSGDVMKAYQWLEEIISSQRGTDLSDRALRKEIIIAEMLLFKDRKQKVWRGTLWLSGREEAIQILDKIIDDTGRDTTLAEHALRLKADYHYSRGEYEEAETAYARLMREFPRGRYHKIAMLRSGESAIARFPGVEFDEADLLEGEAYLRDFQAKYPRDAAENNVPQRLTGVKESLAWKEYTIGRYYERIQKRGSAVFYYKHVIDDFAETTWASEARTRLTALGVAEEPERELELPAPESDLPVDDLDDLPATTSPAEAADSAN